MGPAKVHKGWDQVPVNQGLWLFSQTNLLPEGKFIHLWEVSSGLHTLLVLHLVTHHHAITPAVTMLLPCCTWHVTMSCVLRAKSPPKGANTVTCTVGQNSNNAALNGAWQVCINSNNDMSQSKTTPLNVMHLPKCLHPGQQGGMTVCLCCASL